METEYKKMNLNRTPFTLATINHNCKLDFNIIPYIHIVNSREP